MPEIAPYQQQKVTSKTAESAEKRIVLPQNVSSLHSENNQVGQEPKHTPLFVMILRTSGSGLQPGRTWQRCPGVLHCNISGIGMRARRPPSCASPQSIFMQLGASRMDERLRWSAVSRL